MFFGNAGECILSVASVRQCLYSKRDMVHMRILLQAQDAPDVFADEEDEENVVYFENGCVLENQIRCASAFLRMRCTSLHVIPPFQHRRRTAPGRLRMPGSPRPPSSCPPTRLVSRPTTLLVPANLKRRKPARRKRRVCLARRRRPKPLRKVGIPVSFRITDLRQSYFSEEAVSPRPRKPVAESPEDSGEGESDNGEEAQESSPKPSRRGNGKTASPRRRVTSGSLGGKSGKGGPKRLLLQNATVSNGVEDAWGPWSEECRSFDERRPCTNGNRVGFQSRQCLRTPFECQGPFFRYCIAPC